MKGIRFRFLIHPGNAMKITEVASDPGAEARQVAVREVTVI